MSEKPPEDLIFRMMERMRAEHSASLEAMMTELAATRRVFASVGDLHDKIDALRVDVASFRGEVGKALRQVQGDVIAAENQNIARHGEILNILHRLDKVEDRATEFEEAIQAG